MPATKGGAAKRAAPSQTRRKREAEAAQAEVNGTDRTVEFRGVKLKLFPVIPLKAKAYAPLLNGDNPPIMELISALLGDDQYLAVVGALPGGEDNEAAAVAVAGLIDDLFESYGVNPGESQASPPS